MKENNSSAREKIEQRDSYVRVGLAISLVFAIFLVIVLLFVRTWNEDMSALFQKVELSDFISLTLALFSISLSILFYMKASDTSNLFYDNTYKFTKDTSEMLGRIEAGFGEKLQNLNEGYGHIRDTISNSNSKQQLYDELEDTAVEVNKITKEKDNVIAKLIEESQLKDDEKKKLSEDLEEKELRIKNLNEQIRYLALKIERQDAGQNNSHQLVISDAFQHEEKRSVSISYKKSRARHLLKSYINRKYRYLDDSDNIYEIFENDVKNLTEKEIDYLISFGAINTNLKITKTGKDFIDYEMYKQLS